MAWTPIELWFRLVSVRDCLALFDFGARHFAHVAPSNYSYGKRLVSQTNARSALAKLLHDESDVGHKLVPSRMRIE